MLLLHGAQYWEWPFGTVVSRQIVDCFQASEVHWYRFSVQSVAYAVFSSPLYHCLGSGTKCSFFSEHNKTVFSCARCLVCAQGHFPCSVPDKRLPGFLMTEIMRRKLHLQNRFEENYRAIKRCLSFAATSHVYKPIAWLSFIT